MMCKIITWNVNGLNTPNKRKLVYRWSKNQKADILCLQEVHIRKKDSKLLENRFLGNEFFTLANTKVRGVVFHVNKDLCPTQVFSDSDGRFLVLEIILNKKKTLIVGIYAPNYGKDVFFKDLKEKISEINYGQVILSGDFNGVTDPQKDRSDPLKGNRNQGGKLPKSFFAILEEENLADIWRLWNLLSRKFTFFFQ